MTSIIIIIVVSIIGGKIIHNNLNYLFEEDKENLALALIIAGLLTIGFTLYTIGEIWKLM